MNKIDLRKWEFYSGSLIQIGKGKGAEFADNLHYLCKNHNSVIDYALAEKKRADEAESELLDFGDVLAANREEIALLKAQLKAAVELLHNRVSCVEYTEEECKGKTQKECYDCKTGVVIRMIEQRAKEKI